MQHKREEHEKKQHHSTESKRKVSRYRYIVNSSVFPHLYLTIVEKKKYKKNQTHICQYKLYSKTFSIVQAAQSSHTSYISHITYLKKWKEKKIVVANIFYSIFIIFMMYLRAIINFFVFLFSHLFCRVLYATILCSMCIMFHFFFFFVNLLCFVVILNEE